MRRTHTFLICVFTLLYNISCKDKPTEPAGGSSTGTIALNFPPDRATDQPLSLELNWSLPDELSHSLRVDLYLGTNSSPELIRGGHSANRWLSSILEVNQTYFWRVTVSDYDSVVASSPTWSFETAGPHKPIERYPLETGNYWEYSFRSFWNNITPDSMQHKYADTTILRSYAEIVALDTISIDSAPRPVFVFEEYTTDDISFPCLDTVFYATSSDSLQIVPGCESGPRKICGSNISPRINGSLLLDQFGGGMFVGLSGSVSGVYTHASECENVNSELVMTRLRFPLEVGATWALWPIDDGRLYPRIRRAVIGYRDVETPAGEFTCAMVVWNWDVDNDGEDERFIHAVDYVADIGLVKRTIVVWNSTATSLEFPSGEARGDLHMEYTLNSFNVQE